ncbi:MAG: ferritin [Chloroflexota bacterium]|nr:ferritin [Chloroflexota bacterium]MDE2845001.1 ferritin [Chloroflexota bacterium]
MALNQTIQEALNRHINEEFYASYLYLSMSAYCDSEDLPGFAHWLRIQSQEEYAHAMNLFDFVQDRQGRVTLLPIEQPTVEFGSVLDVMEATLAHEQEVSRLINRLYELASQQSDYPTQVHLQAFITEQIEEEKTAADIIAKLRMIGEDFSSLLLLDNELATRQLTPGL